MICNVKFVCSIGDRVFIHRLKLDGGVVRLIVDKGLVVSYEVTYWWSGDLHHVSLWEDEFDVMDTTKEPNSMQM